MPKELLPEHVSMVNAIASCLNVNTEIQLVVNDTRFVVSQTGAMIHRNSLCSFDMATNIPLHAIQAIECTRKDTSETPVITVTLKRP